MSKKTLLSVGLVAAALSLPACDASQSITPPNQATGGSQFSVTVTGARSAQLNGTATSTGAAAPAGWNAQLRAPDGVSNVLLLTDGTARPGPGVYPISSTAQHGGNAPVGEFTALLSLPGTGGGPPSAFGSVSGTLTITSSSSGSVGGTFRFTAEDPVDSSIVVTVDGTFTTANTDL